MALMKMKDVCLKIGSGATPKGGKEAYIDSGISLIRSQNVLDFAFTYDGLAHINEQQAEKLNNVVVESGDVLLNITGDSVARACMVEEEVLPARVNQHVAIVRANKELVLGSYILYFLQMSKPYLLQLAAGGATRNALTKGMIEDLEIEIPHIQEQKRIVSLIDEIQKKLRVNKEINDNLADQIQAIYSNEFDPTTHRPSGVLAEICSYSSDRILVSELSVSTYFSTENMQPNKMGSIDATSLPSITQTTGCHKGDVLISNIRPYFKKIVYVTDDNCGCSTDVLCFVPKEDQFSAFLFGTLYMDRFFDYMVAGSKGTKMPRGDKQQIMNYPVVLPDKKSLDLFNELIVPMLDKIATNRIENSRLAALRDALLPKLMSGELDISDIDI